MTQQLAVAIKIAADAKGVAAAAEQAKAAIAVIGSTAARAAGALVDADEPASYSGARH